MKKLKNFLLIVVVLVFVFYISFGVLKALYPVKYEEYINEYSEEYNLDAYLVLSVIKAESNFKSDAVSNKNAMGLMQITDKTARWIATKLLKKDFDYENDIKIPEVNISMGTFYMDYLLEKYDGRTTCALAAYNAGPGNVDRWLKNPKYSKDGKNLEMIPFPETQRYVEIVKNNYRIYKLLYKEAEERN